MTISLDKAEALAVDVSFTGDMLIVTLLDGRELRVPFAWFPRLLTATSKQRARWEFIGGGIGIHWPAIDEDISIASLLQPENFMRVPDRQPRSVKPVASPRKNAVASRRRD